MKFEKIPIDNITIPKQPLREQIFKDTLEELANNIKKVGLIQPIIVKQIDKNQFEIIAGHRRFLASRKAGLKDIPCIIFQNTKNIDTNYLKIIENIHREDITAIELAKAIKYLHDNNNSLTQIAEMLSLSQPRISNILSALDLPEDLQNLISDKKLCLEHAKELARIEKKEDREYYTKMCVENGATLKTVRTWIQDYLTTLTANPNIPQPLQIQSPKPTNSIHFTKQCQFCGQQTQSLIWIALCISCNNELKIMLADLQNISK